MYLEWASCTQICMFLSTTRKHCSAINNHTTLTIENNARQFHTIKPIWYVLRRSKVQCLYHWQWWAHDYRMLSHDVTIFVSQKNKHWPCWYPKPILLDLKSFLVYVNTFNFSSINLHGCRPHEKNLCFYTLTYMEYYGSNMYKAFSTHCLRLWCYSK